jgi:hypothetical protein
MVQSLLHAALCHTISLPEVFVAAVIEPTGCYCSTCKEACRLGCQSAARCRSSSFVSEPVFSVCMMHIYVHAVGLCVHGVYMHKGMLAVWGEG